MLRARPLVIMALSLLAGIFIARAPCARQEVLILLIALILPAVAAVLFIPGCPLIEGGRPAVLSSFINMRKAVRRIGPGLMVSAFFLIGFMRCQALLDHQLRVAQKLTEGQQIIAEGRIYALEPREKGIRALLGQVKISARDHEKEWELGKIYVDDLAETIDQRGTRLQLGDRIRLSALYSPGQAAPNEGGFDERAYEYSRQIYGHFKKASHPVLLAEGAGHPYWHLRQLLESLRSGLAGVFDRNLPAEEAGLLSAMALGARSSLDAEVRDLFTRSGLSHILAISGLHVFLMASLLLGLLRSLRLNLPLAALISGMGIIFYGMMTGNAVSTQRAVWMYLLVLLGKCLGEAYDSLSALALAALVILIPNPMAIGDPGFQLSFAAILGMQLVARPMQERYRSDCKEKFKARQHQLFRMQQRQLPWNRGRDRVSGSYQPNLTQRILGQIILALGIQLAVLPLLAFCYSEIALYVIFLNLLLLPFLGLVLASGLLGGFLGLAAELGFLKAPADLCLGISHCLLYFFEWSSDLSLRLPGARMITGKPPIWLILVYYGSLFYLLYGRERRGAVYPGQRRAKRQIKKRRIQGRISAGVALALLLSPPILWSASLPYLAKAEFTMLDVGQGDGLYFCDGRGGHYMIDGGSTSLDQLGKRRILPFLKARGIRQIRYWFVSHTDLDHISGLEEALKEGYSIQNLVFSANMPYVDEGRNPAYERLTALAKRNGCRVLLWDQGDQLCIEGGGEKKEILLVRCLGPGRDHLARGANENSLILSITMPGLSAFCAGDIGTQQEETLLRKGMFSGDKREGKLSLYKASHHGSKGANSREILQRLRPDLIWISAGIRNRYGHPGKETLERMKEIGCPIDRTMYQGQMTLRRKGSDWKYQVRFP